MGDYMRRTGNRTITVNKAELIAKIEENREAHKVAYDKAERAYKIEALKQLKQLTKEVKEGSTTIRLNLTTPVDNRENYDKIIGMFEWDVADEVELTQQEYNEYILDETEVSRHAAMSNAMYLDNL